MNDGHERCKQGIKGIAQDLGPVFLIRHQPLSQGGETDNIDEHYRGLKRSVALPPIIAFRDKSRNEASHTFL